MSKITNYTLGMEDEGRLVYNKKNKKEYIPAGLTSRKDVQKYRKQRIKRRRNK